MIPAALNPYWLGIKLAAFAAVVLAAYLYGRADGKEAGAAEVAAFERSQARTAVEAAQQTAHQWEQRGNRYQQRAENAEAAAAQFQKDVGDANERANRLAAAVAAGDVRFRKLWAGCRASVPASGSTAADPGQPADGAELQAASLGRIDRAVSACQAQATALLRVAECDRDPARAECRE